MDKNPKPVNLICVSPFKLEGRHVAVDELLTNVEPELAKELTGAGRTRLAREGETGGRKTKAEKEAG